MNILMPLLLMCFFVLPARSQDSSEANYRLVKDIPYRQENDLSDYAKERCRLDLYVPTDRKGFATVVWFHGGGLTGGNR